ncbi:hypothetical protein BDV38DRAFT_282680 [Aspergillus pseudotamarii]|uniref:Uncharacterized protein n=1 Tax=Aspergillus pseudotamarii TaxID=132259 RepID=A0A5N6SV23_ASPPS|nr:uncharacterized protein BDV38DRAFT_282680 [Aspergillus pseudotamarii]KAE8137747.1 hypothetical protein BDV38DRAFT_282680 [Aspergillus pseudotamarii]
MDTREIAEDIASHLDGIDIPNLLWGQTAHLYHLGLRSSPCSDDGSSGNHQRALCVSNVKRTAKVLTLARHIESLILRLCLNLDTDNAPTFFKAIEEIVGHYGENAQNTDIWKQLLCDLDNKNNKYGEYLQKQKNEWKHERPNPQTWEDCPIRNLRRSAERQRYTKQLRVKLVYDGKLPSKRN